VEAAQASLLLSCVDISNFADTGMDLLDERKIAIIKFAQ
jgi:hypothetical protein